MAGEHRVELNFSAWLQQNGAEILPVTNEHEAVRFRGIEVGVMYKSGKFSNKYAKDAFYSFRNNKKWDGRPPSTGRQKTYVKEKRTLLKRDGGDCFYCGLPLDEDVTLEHLIPLTSGGKNSYSNMVLAHENCNQIAGNKTIVEKVNLAIKTRSKNETNS